MEIFERQTDERSSEVRPIAFLENEQIPHLPAPLVRVNCCGLLSLEVLTEVVSSDPPRGRYQVIATHTLRGRGAVPALMLLKLLASQPHRFASKDWLSTQMHEEMERGALIRLDTMASQLRTLLGFGGLDHQETSAVRLRLVEYLRNGRGSGPGYRLAPYPLIWLDTEALAWNVEQAARMERFGQSQDAVAFWQRAYALASRGTFLPDDLYSGWAADKRAEIEGALRQSVHALARFYLAQQGEAGTEEAMRLLRSYWLSHKTDEDALRPLMELLGKDERYQEAEAYYQQLLSALREQDGDQVPDPRTQDLREFLRTRQMRREEGTVPSINGTARLATGEKRIDPSDALTSPSTPSLLASQRHDPLASTEPFLSSPLLPHTGSEQGVFFSPLTSMTLSTTHGAQTDWSVWFGLKLGQIVTLVDNWQELALYSDRLQTILDQEIVVLDAMKSDGSNENYLLSRRQMLITIATLPMALSPSIQTGIISTVMIEKLLVRCAASLTACWHLLKGSELSLVEQALSTYLLSLVTLAQQPSRYQKTAARLASQAYRLYGIVALHRNNLQARENYCQQALYFGEITQNPSVLVSAQISLASTYYYNKKPLHAANTYQEALVYQDAIPPLQRSRLHVELAVVYAQQKLEQDALQALDLAKQQYPQHPENDPSFLYAEFSPASMILEEGLTYLALAQHFPDRDYKLDAWKSFAQIDELRFKSTVPERIFFEITNHRAATALLLQELGLVKTYLQKGIEGAQRLQSKQRRQEASDIYEQALYAWPHEKSLKELQDLFHASDY